MRKPSARVRVFLLAVVAIFGVARSALAAYPAPREGTWVVKDFRFGTGETLPEHAPALPDAGRPEA